MIILFVVIIVVLIAAVLVGRYVFARRAARRAESWEGTVASKDRSSPDGQNMYHYVTVNLTDGQVKKVQIRGKLWKTISPGDRLVKRQGAYDPERSTQ